ncbi:hypothetical protein VNO78_33825 [Psophocarpus tetragonolobus]|uniref:Uncharacterized protein n=1 Tax=Psophocarpus tetragonolobus TaxID=3891 RepID=A0AAN9RLN0_PSOTE
MPHHDYYKEKAFGNVKRKQLFHDFSFIDFFFPGWSQHLVKTENEFVIIITTISKRTHFVIFVNGGGALCT